MNYLSIAMFKWSVLVICVSFLTTVSCEPGYDKIKDQKLSKQDEQPAPATVIRRQRQAKDNNFEIEFIKRLDLTELQNKELAVLSPLNNLEDQQLKAEINSILTSLDTSKHSNKCKNIRCEVDSIFSQAIPEERTARSTDTYDNSNSYHDRDKYYDYSDDRRRPPPPHYDPPPHDDWGREPPPPPPPPPHHHDEPPHHHGGPPPPPPHHGGPPPPPPHHGGPPPPPHHGRPPPPPHHRGPPPPHHRGPPPPPSPFDDYRSGYYDHPPPPPEPDRYEDSYSRSKDDRQTRQSSYNDNSRYYDRGPPPPPPPHHAPPRPYRGAPPHRGDPPPRHHRDPYPPPHHRGPAPPPPHGGPPRGGPGGPPPPPRGGPQPRPHNDGPPPRDHYRGQEAYDDRSQQRFEDQPPRRNQPNEERQNSNNNKPAKIMDASQNADRFASDTSTSESQNDDNQYMLDVRFAEEIPEQSTKSSGTRQPPFLFQAAVVTPESD